MGKIKKFLIPFYRFFLFFILIAFIVTCNFLLFLRSMDLDIEILHKNAFITFINIIFLSLLICIVNGIRRKLTDERAIKRITQSLKKITKGDFSEKIKPVNIPVDSKFNPIIEDINLLTAELSGVETLRNDFISNVSHELKTPLAVIQNYAAMLQSASISDEERVKYSKSISDASRRLSDLITNILKLNKLENQKIFPEGKRFNLSEQLCECLLSFENIWDSKNLEIEADIEENIFVNTDEELLMLVWNNLFSNAVKFTDNNGKISVSMKADNEKCIVKVADTGCGMSRETGAHIFEKFYQGDTSHAARGNGLGLALVKRVIDILGGEIEVESELGKGSTFTIILRGGNSEKVS